MADKRATVHAGADLRGAAGGAGGERHCRKPAAAADPGLYRAVADVHAYADQYADTYSHGY